MKARCLVAALMLVLAMRSSMPASSADPTPTVTSPFSLSDCPLTPPWFESREKLGGSYIANGWSNGLLMVLRLTAISGAIQGFFIQSTVDEDGAELQDSYTVTGIYDEEQTSLRIDMFLSTVTMVGTWDAAALEFSYPGSDVTVASASFYTIDDAQAVELLEAWNDREPRNAASELAITGLTRAYESIPFAFDLVTEPARMSADQAATLLFMPELDTLSLLSYGWLASVGFTVRPTGNLPNQLNRYDLHMSESLYDSFRLASCVQGALLDPDAYQPLKGHPEADLMLMKQYAGTDQIPGNTEIMAISGPALVIATIYGSAEIQATAIETVLTILGDVHETPV